MAQKETLVYHLLSIFNDYNHINYNNIVFISLKEQLLYRLTIQEQGREKDIIGKELEYMPACIYMHWCYGDSKGH